MKKKDKYRSVFYCMYDTLPYLFDRALKMRDEINEDDEADKTFDEGVLFGYQSCLYSISGQLEVFGVKPKKLRFKRQEEIERTLLNIKSKKI